MIYYSASNGGFYDSTIHATLPTDAVEITAEQHAALLNGQSQGKVIAADTNGFPILIDPPPPVLQPVTRVTPRQARLVLATQPSPDPAHPTMLAFVEAAFDALLEPDRTVARITWEYATEILRGDPLIEQLKPIMGLNDEQIDALFAQAAQL